jgi:hypothetical protein
VDADPLGKIKTAAQILNHANLLEYLTCGHVGCCDSSPNKHATKHFKTTEHPIIRSFEPGEDWEWCYVDEMMVQ